MKVCLVCCSDALSSHQNDNLLCKNVQVFFLMKNVFQVRDEQLEENLKRNGNPFEWIQLCEHCTQLTRKALDLHCQIVKLDRELWSVKKLIVDKTKSSISVADHSNENIWGRTRSFVKKSNFQSGNLAVNPFIEGDKLATANYYLRQDANDHDDNFRLEATWQLDYQDNDKVDSEDNDRKSINQNQNSQNRITVDGKLKCRFCSKLFFTSICCSKHEQEIHASIPNQYPCRLCEMTWNSVEQLWKHMARIHKVRWDGSPLTKQKKKTGVIEKQLENDSKVDQDALINKKDKSFSEEPLQLPNEVKAEPLDISVLNSDVEEAETFDDGGDSDWQPNEDNDLADEDEVAEVKQLTVTDAQDHSKIIKGKGRPKKDRLRVKGKFKCQYCDKLFFSTSGCVKHEKERHPSTPAQFPCDICGKAWNSLEYLNRHRRRKHKIKLTTRQVREIKVDKAPPPPNKSSIIHGKKFRIRADGKVKCFYCDKVFFTTAGCIKHENEYHAKIPGQFPCDICGISWNSRNYLMMHRNQSHKHISMEPLEKDLMVPPNHNLIPVARKKRRKNVWVNGKLKCASCEKEFKSRKGLWVHEREKHDDSSEKIDYVCDLCGKVWKSLIRLRAHRKKAHKLNADGSEWVPKKCSPRQREVSDTDDKEGYGITLPNGKKIGKKYLAVDGKLKCRSCDKLFNSTEGMWKHESEKHPKKVGQYVCTHCGMAFNSMNYLRIHTERKHWMRMDGTPYVPPWVPTRKYKWKKSEK